ncbi:LPXTG cell wall anchor domain-containing protein [Marinithermofilum abyssi]|uniref:LPXTG cell wall anchor domain-containing protein n=1 Tax=Marinithermofilum abyssi TaxID=1571185 RepID=UPI001665466C|nr:LPXTG cell wall anchor domain-containing protein [Marinithermofilum abyssi]
MKNKWIPVTATVTLGVLSGSSFAFADPGLPLNNDLPKQVESAPVKAQPVQNELEVGLSVGSKTPKQEQPKPEPPTMEPHDDQLSPSMEEPEVQKPPEEQKKNPAEQPKQDVSQKKPEQPTPLIQNPVNQPKVTQIVSHESDKQMKKPKNDQKEKSLPKKLQVKPSTGKGDQKQERVPKTIDGGKMPKTGSPAPLVALLGLVIAAAGWGVTRLKRHEN